MILILVDVDNLLGALAKIPQPFSLGAGSPELVALVPPLLGPASTADGVVVSMALNLPSAAMFAGWEALQRLGTRIGRTAAPKASTVRVEVALTLPVPESADQALERLLAFRPGDEPEGEVTQVRLLTLDFGLSDRFHALLGTLADRSGAAPWWRWDLRDPIERSAPAPTVAMAAGQPSWVRPTTVVASEALCREVSQRPVQCPADWPVLLETLRRSPWALSQVGVTFPGATETIGGSVRGVARLARHLGPSDERPALLACHWSDGVEVSHGSFAEAWTFQAIEAQAQPASVGPGAVRLTWAERGEARGLTVRTSLPVWLIQELAGRGAPLRAAPFAPRLDEASALGTHTGLVGGPRVLVRLKAFSSHLAAKITGRKEVWWWQASSVPGHEPSPRGHYKLPDAQRLCPRPLRDVEACLAIAPGPQLYLRSPVPRGERVMLPSPLQPGQLGLGLWDDDGREVVCAVLARHRLPRGGVPCTPIQNVKLTRLVRLLNQAGLDPLQAEGVAPLLQELPLLTDLT